MTDNTIKQTTKKRVLIFSLVYLPRFVGGAEIAIKEITDRLGDNFDFDMITLALDSESEREERIGNITVHRIGWRGDLRDITKIPFLLSLNKYFFPIIGFFKALSLHGENKYDLTWSVMASYNSFAALFFKFWKRKIPFLLTLQEGDPISHIKKRAKFVWPLFVSIFKRADCIQAISRSLKDFALEMGAERDVVVVPNGVDIKKFSAIFSLSEIEEWKKKIGKENDEKFIVTASRLVKKNAVDDIIRSLEFLPSHVKLVVAGIGEEEEKLRDLAIEKNVLPRVVFLGHVTQNDLPRLFKACDVFVRPSRSEGFGNSFVEAMAAHLPVVATPVGGIVDFLEDGVTGLFVEVGDPEDIAEKVKTLLENKNVREPIIHNAYEMVTAKYDWDIVANEMKEIFNGL